MGDNSRITKNTMFLYIRMILVMCISLYTSRVILDNLGVEDFGLFNVVGSVTTMLLFINGAMASATQRFLTIELGNNNVETLKKVFNVSVSIHVCIALFIILLCEIGGSWFIDNKMIIPAGREYAVNVCFHVSMIGIFFSILSVPYNALLVAHERMSAFAYISIFEVLFQLFVAYLIGVVCYDKLITYTILNVISSIAVIWMYMAYCRNKFLECKFKFYKFCPLYTEMMKFASWILLGHFSVIVNTAIQNMMLNVFFSPVINAARGIAIKVSGVVTRFNDNFQLAVSPQIVKSVALKDMERSYELIIQSSKYSLYLVWLLSFPIVVCMDDLLNLWLVEVPDKSSIFITLILINGLFETLSNPLNKAIGANGIIKYAETIGGICGILNLPLSYVCLKLGYGPESVFLIMICITIIRVVIRLYFTRKYINIPLFEYLKEVILTPLFVFALSVIPVFIVLYYGGIQMPTRLTGIVFVSLLACVCTILSIAIFGLREREKAYIIQIIKTKIKI